MLVIRESARLAALGVPIGLTLAYAGGRLLALGMNGIAILELSTFVVVTLALTATVVLASWFPASRAARVDPVEALRSE